MWLLAMTDDWWAGFVAGGIAALEQYLAKYAAFVDRYGV